MEPSYLAGLFDGEGSVTITKPSPGAPNRHRLIAQIAMTHAPTIQAVHAAAGGRIQLVDQSRYNSNAKTRYDWRISDTAAADFLKSIQPWLITKREPVEIALRFAETRSTRGIALTPEQLSQREDMRLQLRQANQRGTSHDET